MAGGGAVLKAMSPALAAAEVIKGINSLVQTEDVSTSERTRMALSQCFSSYAVMRLVAAGTPRSQSTRSTAPADRTIAQSSIHMAP